MLLIGKVYVKAYLASKSDECDDKSIKIKKGDIFVEILFSFILKQCKNSDLLIFVYCKQIFQQFIFCINCINCLITWFMHCWVFEYPTEGG